MPLLAMVRFAFFWCDTFWFVCRGVIVFALRECGVVCYFFEGFRYVCLNLRAQISVLVRDALCSVVNPFG